MIFIASSWKQRERVRKLAQRLRALDYGVYDFTDPRCRKCVEMPPEKFPEKFDPEKHNYWNYINKSEAVEAVNENRRMIDCCKILVLILPCGIDATADWAYAVALKKTTIIIGTPNKGEYSLAHNWANGWLPDEEAFISFLRIHERMPN